MVEDGDHDVGERDPEVEDDVPEGVDQDPHRPVDEVDRDEVRLLRAEHAGQQHHAARVVKDRAQHRLLEVALRHLRRGRQTPCRRQVGDEGGVVVGQGEVDEQNLAGEPLAQ